MSQVVKLDPPPRADSFSDLAPVFCGAKWYRWLLQIQSFILSSINIVGTAVKLTGQSAAIVTTVLYTTTQAGMYRINEYARVTVADGVSSSLALTLTWREGAQTCTKTFTALAGDTVTTFESNTWTIYADSGTNITYAYAYASNTPAKMRFRVSLAVEQVTNA